MYCPACLSRLRGMSSVSRFLSCLYRRLSPFLLASSFVGCEKQLPCSSMFMLGWCVVVYLSTSYCTPIQKKSASTMLGQYFRSCLPTGCSVSWRSAPLHHIPGFNQGRGFMSASLGLSWASLSQSARSLVSSSSELSIVSSNRLQPPWYHLLLHEVLPDSVVLQVGDHELLAIKWALIKSRHWLSPSYLLLGGTAAVGHEVEPIVRSVVQFYQWPNRTSWLTTALFHRCFPSTQPLLWCH